MAWPELALLFKAAPMAAICHRAFTCSMHDVNVSVRPRLLEFVDSALQFVNCNIHMCEGQGSAESRQRFGHLIPAARLSLMESFMAAERGVNGKAEASRPPAARAREAAVASRPPEVMEPTQDSQQGTAKVEHLAAQDALFDNDPWRNAKGAAGRSAGAPSAPLAPPPCPSAPRHGPAGGLPPPEHIPQKAPRAAAAARLARPPSRRGSRPCW
ncbi:unnamed protein product [Prorocentrum cordatum]|uniref:Uncharacterized protein n=1 Tax=Prorocentrum cordatum TaxID=2364126 RepID=A0ABN9X225_9DINO|nr:unnamed protein product [Polarella glacialis]